MQEEESNESAQYQRPKGLRSEPPRQDGIPYGSIENYQRHVDNARLVARELDLKLGPKSELAKFMLSDGFLKAVKPNEGESVTLMAADEQERVIIVAWPNGRQAIMTWGRHALGGWEFHKGWLRRLPPSTAIKRLTPSIQAWLAKRAQQRAESVSPQVKHRQPLKKAG